MSAQRPYRLIISGGGTGGHIFPALAIARAFQDRYPDTEFLFVGATGKMEMKKVAEAGFRIVGLWISGLQRRITLANLLFPVKLIFSFFKARKILKDFKPHVVIGTGGYASSPMVMAATRAHIPTLIQEQNSYAGLANRQVASRVARVCVAYPGMEKYFPAACIRLTGNPVRKDLLQVADMRREGLSSFGFSENGKTLLVLGGSLGARTINDSLLAGIDKLIDAQVQVLWQTGSMYLEKVRQQLADKELRRIRVVDFITRMDLAYAAADVVISRAGALAISELTVAKKPAILVPSPNVAEDHQTKNALALVQQDAALLVPDAEAVEILVNEALNLLYDDSRCAKLSAEISKLAKPHAAEEIAAEIERLIQMPS